MKRASFAATAALATLMAAGAANADQASDLGRDYAAFRQNTIDMMLKSDIAGARALSEKTIDDAFKGTNTVTLTLNSVNRDIGLMLGVPGEMTITNPTVTLNFNTMTTKKAYVEFIKTAESALGNIHNGDAQIGIPALIQNTKLTAAAQDAVIAADGKTAVVENSLTGTFDTPKMLKDLGLPEALPFLPRLVALPQKFDVKMDCRTTLALDAAGAFTVTAEECKTALTALVKSNLPELKAPDAVKTSPGTPQP